MIIVLFGIMTCTSSTEPISANNNSPSDHAVSSSGVMHKNGLSNPLTNCVECHGTDLKGGDVGVSCYSCHGKKW